MAVVVVEATAEEKTNATAAMAMVRAVAGRAAETAASPAAETLARRGAKPG